MDCYEAFSICEGARGRIESAVGRLSIEVLAGDLVAANVVHSATELVGEVRNMIVPVSTDPGPTSDISFAVVHRSLEVVVGELTALTKVSFGEGVSPKMVRKSMRSLTNVHIMLEDIMFFLRAQQRADTSHARPIARVRPHPHLSLVEDSLEEEQSEWLAADLA